MKINFLRRLLSINVYSVIAIVFVLFFVGVLVFIKFTFVDPDLATTTGTNYAALPKSGNVLSFSTPETVVWTNLANMITEDGDLEQKSGYCVGCPDAGATSSQKIISGDGYFEFKVPEVSYYIYAGLTTVGGSTGTSAIMPFTLEISGGYVSVRENGVYKSDTPVVPNDIFKISVESGVVKYYKNGTAFYTSLMSPSYPLVADVSMQKVGSKLWAGKIATSTAEPTVSAPVIDSFIATPQTITSGQSSTLSWSVTGATSISLNPPISLSPDVSVVVSPTQTTTYTLNATNSTGSVSKSVTVTVQAPIVEPPVSGCPTTTPPQGQFIGCYFDNKDLTGFKLSRTDNYPLAFDWGKGSPSSTIGNDTFSARWTGSFNFESGNYIFTTVIDDGVRVFVDGVPIIDRWSDSSSRTNTATVNMTAGQHIIKMDYYENKGFAKAKLSWLKSITSPVPAPVISSFIASPTSVTSGQSSTLSWSVSGATSLTIDQGVGTVTGTTSKVVSPTATTTYTLTATNSSGSITKSVTVNVSSTASLPVISFFTASPTSVSTGQSSTLSWSVTGATSLSINQSIGTVTGTTSKVVTPTATTTYTLTATNSSGVVSSSVSVIVTTVVVPPSSSTVELPRVYINSSYPTLPSSRTIRTVQSNCSGVANCYTDFQGALNAAQPGDEVVMAAGFTAIAPSGGFNLPNKNSTQWIVIRSANISSLPAAGTRVSPTHASQMPKILSQDNLAAIKTATGASYYRFVGVEISATSGVTTNSGLVMLGSVYETNVANQAHHIIFDRVYVHGVPNANTRRGFFLNSGETAIVDSFVSDFRDNGADAQAALGGNGSGPLKMVNNYLEASGENFMIGGVDSVIQGVQMSDVEIRGNLFAKPLSWRGGSWVIKNLFELKVGQRILIDGNIFENSWAHAQSGMALNIKTANQDGGMTWAHTKDVTITNNIIRHAALGITITDRDNNGPSGSTANVYIANNVFDDISASRWGNGSGGTFVQSSGTTSNVTVSHNTALHDGSTIVASGTPAQNFKFMDNIVFLNLYGIKGDGTASGNGTISTYFPGSTFAKNVMVGDGSVYPTNNFYPANASAIGFTNYNNGNGGNYTLLSSSPYRNAGTDGKDIGANINVINSAITCVMSGVCGG